MEQLTAGFVRGEYVSRMQELATSLIEKINIQLTEKRYLNDPAWDNLNSDNKIELTFNLDDMLVQGYTEEQMNRGDYPRPHKLIFEYIEKYYNKLGWGTSYNTVHSQFSLYVGPIKGDLA